MTATSYTPIAARLRRIPRAIRRLAVATALVFVAVVIAAMGTGVSFAFWNGAVPTGAATVSTGSIDLRVNGEATYMIPDLMTTALLPGRSVVQPAPVELSNVGSVPLSVAWTGTTVASSSADLRSSLIVSMRLATTPTCTTTSPSTALPTTIAPISLAPGATARVCVEVRLAASAPASVQGQMASLDLDLTGTQVRP